MSNLKERLETMPDVFEGTSFFENPGFEEAILGYSEDGRLIYSYEKMIDCMVAESINVDVNKASSMRSGDADYAEDEMSRLEEAVEDAIDWIEYNTIRTIPYMGEKAPIILYELPV